METIHVTIAPVPPRVCITQGSLALLDLSCALDAMPIHGTEMQTPDSRAFFYVRKHILVGRAWAELKSEGFRIRLLMEVCEIVQN